MRHLLAIILCALSLSLYAVEYKPIRPATTMPRASMESVNNINFMSSGSTTYSPAVYAVGAYSPSRPTTAIRRGAPPGGTGQVTDDTFKNPQFSPIGDAVLPFILMAFSYILFRLVRRKGSLSPT
jgi:hypothetical protein